MLNTFEDETQFLVLGFVQFKGFQMSLGKE